MTKINHFNNLTAAFLNITPKPYVTNFIFGTDIPVILPKKKNKFYICILWITNSFSILKSDKKVVTCDL